MRPNEHREAYASPAMREVLVTLAASGILDGWFLTGGTALSVFYLGHRTSEDLDFFSLTGTGLSEVALRLRTIGFGDVTQTVSSSTFARFVVNSVKVDFVHDPLSLGVEREVVELEQSAPLTLDSISNIFSNKLAASVSRSEAKDFIDLYFLAGEFPQLSLDAMIVDAKAKEAMFDDTAAAAYQIERNLNQVRGSVGPGLLKQVDDADFTEFFKQLVARLYARQE